MENKGSPSYHDVLRKVLSTSILSNSDRIYIKYLLGKPELIDIVDTVNPITVIQKSAIEKPANYPCKNLPDVACQDTIRLSQAEIIEPKSPNKSTKTKSSTSTLGGQQNKGKDAGCITTGLTGSTTGLTGSFKVLQNKSKLKVVKPKKPEIGVWKTVQAKGHSKHQKAKPKLIGEFPAKPQKQRDAKDASWLNKSKQLTSSPKCQFHDRNRQWNNFPTSSMPFSSHESPMRMPCGSYFYMPYSCPIWSYNPWMPASYSYFGQNHVTYREPVINKSLLRINDRFHQRDRSMQKNKHKVIKQVYRIKKDE